MVAAAVLLDADVALRAVFGVCADVVGRFAVVRAFRQPPLDRGAVCGRVVVVAAHKAERKAAAAADDPLRTPVRAADHNLTVGAGAEA